LTGYQDKGTTIVIASWNVNSIKARLEHVTTWLKARNPDVLLLQELKGTEFPSDVFSSLGYESGAVTQKAYSGVAILSRSPIKRVSNVLSGDEADTHARYLEVIISGVRIVDIYLPNGNPIGTEKFDNKLAWMERLITKMSQWKADGVPTVIGGDFKVIPEDIDCGSMMLSSNPNREHSTAPCWTSAIPTPSGRCMQKADSSPSGITFGRPSRTTAGSESIISLLPRRFNLALKRVRSTKDHALSRSLPITRQSCSP